MVRLNQRCFAYALSRIEAGAVDTGDVWELAPAEADQLAEDPGRYYLGEDATYQAGDALRFRYPVGKILTGTFTVFQAALAAIRDTAVDVTDVYEAAGRLLGAIETGGASEDDTGAAGGAAGDDGDGSGQDAPPPPPPKVPPAETPAAAGEGGSNALEGEDLVRALAEGDQAARRLALSRLRGADGAWPERLTGADLRRAFGTNKFGRTLQVRADTVDLKARTAELSFSSEEPYERWWGIEILGHEPNEVRLGRLNSGGAVLVNHNIDDWPGVVRKAWVGEDRKGRALTAYSRSPRGEEILNDLADDMKPNTSVAYQIHDMRLLDPGDEDRPPVYRVIDWEPLEVSLVAIPADPTVGVGRDLAGAQRSMEESTMKKRFPVQPFSDRADEAAGGGGGASAPAPPKSAPVDVERVRTDAASAERERVNTILALGREHEQTELAEKHVEAGTSIDAFRKLLLETLTQRRLEETTLTPHIGLSERETRRYSVMKLLRHLAFPTNRGFLDEAGFELECSKAVQDIVQRAPRGAYLPYEVITMPLPRGVGFDLNQLRGLSATQLRDLAVGTPSAGGYTVATDLLVGSFIEILNNKMLVRRLGATILDGLVGDVAIPKQSGGATAYWIDTEGGDVTESQQTFAQLALTPKTVGALTEYTRQLLLQSSIDVEAFVKRDLANRLALAIDAAAINGSGSSGEPEGVLNTTGIGVVSETDGSAPDWDDVVDVWKEIAIDNADIGTMGWMTNPDCSAKLMKTPKVSGQPVYIMGDTFDPEGFQRLLNMRVGITNQVPNDLTQGGGSNLSALILGNWADLIIAGWGTVDLRVDPYTKSASGGYRIVALKSTDIGLRHPESFAAKPDCITT